MTFVPTDWENGVTGVTAEQMDRIEAGIDDVHNNAMSFAGVKTFLNAVNFDSVVEFAADIAGDTGGDWDIRRVAAGAVRLELNTAGPRLVAPNGVDYLDVHDNLVELVGVDLEVGGGNVIGNQNVLILQATDGAGERIEVDAVNSALEMFVDNVEQFQIVNGRVDVFGELRVVGDIYGDGGDLYLRETSGSSPHLRLSSSAGVLRLIAPNGTDYAQIANAEWFTSTSVVARIGSGIVEGDRGVKLRLMHSSLAGDYVDITPTSVDLVVNNVVIARANSAGLVVTNGLELATGTSRAVVFNTQGGDDALTFSDTANRYSFTADGTVAAATVELGTLEADAVEPTVLWPYDNANGSVRWQGIGSPLAQAHTSSSVDYKKQIAPVDLDRSLFSRLEGVHYQYRKNHPYADRWRDWDAEARPHVGRLGVTYENVLDVVPEWCYEVDGMKAVSYDAMLPDLVGDYLALRRLVLDLRDRLDEAL